MHIEEYEKKTFIDYLKSKLPEEGCGLLLLDGAFVECDNVVEESGIKGNGITKETSFFVDMQAYLRYSRQLKAIVHSHMTDDDKGPSEVDIKHQRATGVPWIVVVFDSKKNFVRIHEIK